MARLALRPGTVDFVESLFKSAPGGLLIEDVRIEQDSPLSAMTVREARDLVPGALVLAIRRGTETIAAPGPDIPLSAGDLVAAVGEEHELRLLERSSQRSREDMSPESAVGPSY
jgi:K+/H+ antiporter YhaU regulatory subunit KhtT